MTSLLDSIQGYLTSAVVNAAASHLGESEAGVSKAIKGIVATLLAGMAGKANDASALGGLFDMLNDKNNHGALDNLGSLIGGGNLAHGDPKDVAGRLVGTLFGDKTGGLLQAITAFGGLKSGSASSLLGLAGPLVMGVLGKKIAADHLNADGLKSLLFKEQDSFKAALPAGVGDMLGFGSMAGAAKPAVAAAATSAAATAAAVKRGTPAWMWAVPALLGALLIGWLLTRGGDRKIATAPVETAPIEAAAPEAAPPADTVVQPTIIDEAANVASGFVRSLGAFELKGASGGVEERLVGFIDSGRAPCTEADCWFSFDRLTFNTGSAELDMEKSRDQINNIAEILKAYPGIQLKIGGYTDNTGSEDANMKLSMERAQAVVNAVSALGVDASRLVAEGYGSQFPRADNATEEGRALNRRIDVRVRERS